MAGAQLITIPFNEALRALEAENLPKKLYFLMGNDHFLQKFFIDKVYDKATGKSSVQKIYLIPDDISSLSSTPVIRVTYAKTPCPFISCGKPTTAASATPLYWPIAPSISAVPNL